MHICVHICTRGCCLRARQCGGVHAHKYGCALLSTAPCLQDTSCKPTALTGTTSLAQLPDSLISRVLQDPRGAEVQLRPCHNRGKGDLVSRQQMQLHPTIATLPQCLGGPSIIPQRCSKDEMHLRTSCQQVGCQQRMGWEKACAKKELSSGEWDSRQEGLVCTA